MHQEFFGRSMHTLSTVEDSSKDHIAFVIEHDDILQDFGLRGACRGGKQRHVEITGEDLSMADMVAVAWYSCQIPAHWLSCAVGEMSRYRSLMIDASYKCPVHLSQSPMITNRVNESVAFLTRHLDEGNIVYGSIPSMPGGRNLANLFEGINTGYGGSADTRSADFISMQRGLIQHHNSAVLLSSDQGVRRSGRLDDLRTHSLPRSVVRGSMLARCNSLMRGHSAVRLAVIQNIVTLLNLDFIPIVPLRGSISASGDLTPLSYIAGALEGNPDIYLDCQGPDGVREVLNARDALNRAQLTQVVMMPKEGLGLMNGTAVSCAAASLALHEIHYLALAAQALTGMCTEALRGSSDNYHPFISKVRPHPGQIQVARNIRRQLHGSKLVVGTDARFAGLYQDRYGLRTSPQWIGPQLEDLLLAQQQVEIELNSTTDNPLVDIEQQHVHHGGNFQAAALTSAMEKARLALQMLGKLMFAQSSELINPMLNNTLTPNLCFDDPDVSFSFKGVDINMAAYMSELAYLANPVSSHVQSAEMHNQAVNSLALISTRYTMDAVELVSLMTATYLYTVCQALDIHVLHIESLARIVDGSRKLFDDIFGEILESDENDKVWDEVMQAIQSGLALSKSKDTSQKCHATADATISPLVKALNTAARGGNQGSLTLINNWVERLTSVLESSIRTTRAKFAAEGPDTLEYLGNGSKVMYRYVRETLGIPLHHGLVEHPTYPSNARGEIQTTETVKKTIGSRITVIYEALRSGEMRRVLIDSLS